MATNAREVGSNPPRTYFSVWQRLLRGYGPLAVLAALLLMVSLLIPSKVQSSGVSTTGNGRQGATAANGAKAGTATTVPGAAVTWW